MNEAPPISARRVGDAKAFINDLTPSSVACAVADPPWALQGGGRFAETASYALQSIPEILGVLADLKRAIVPGGWLYLFAPAGHELEEVIIGMHASGWTFQRELAWEKGRNGLGAWQNAHEPVLVYSNGASRGYELSGRYRSILSWPRPAGRTAKPPNVYRAFLEMSTRAGELAVDPWCGTNPLRAACETLRPARRWLANDALTEAEVAASVRKAGGIAKQRDRKAKPAVGQAVLAGGPA